MLLPPSDPVLVPPHPVVNLTVLRPASPEQATPAHRRWSLLSRVLVPEAVGVQHLAGVLVTAPHAHALHFSQPLDAYCDGDDRRDCADRGNTAEAEIRLLDKVLQVHAIQSSNEGTGCEAKSPDGEAKIQKHERVAVCI